MKLRSVLWAGTAALVVSLSLGGFACSDDDDSNTPMTTADAGFETSDTGAMADDAGMMAEDSGEPADSGVDPFATCRATIAAKETQFETELQTWSINDAAEMVRNDGDQRLEADYAGRYRDELANHVGCAPRAMYTNSNAEPFSIDNEATVPEGSPATITGYPCAAKQYAQPNEDTTKPIVILVHGNSSGPTTFEEYFRQNLAGTTITNVAGFEVIVDTMVREQLSAKLIAAGYQVIGFDARTDLVNLLTDYNADQATGNPFRNIDHGWIVPLLQSLIKAVMDENPSRSVSIIGHSLGVTAVRDALRRLYVDSLTNQDAVNPYSRLKDVILLSGANHGVSSGSLLCPGGSALINNMRATVTCEMGELASFTPTYFSQPINGPGDLFSTPCADGDYAFGQRDACGDNVVQWTTVTMEDLPGGALQDEFVSEASSSLDNEGCVENELITLGDFDSSGYFFTGAPGFLANHFGSARSEAGMTLILSKLAD